ncbi:site-specific integrase [Rossellomorea marisflavi]|uniref:site-specific integrase n=1 Tax=Rossellomorea marisflavi TaxID=189381 RepID=UPI00215CB0F8|nr:site-specific integrase [Rossellomorea marisflavi]
MKFKKGQIGESGFYYCTKHRKKISITVRELSDCITDAIQILIVPTISPKTANAIKTISVKAINNIAKGLRTTAFNMQIELEELCIKVSKKFNPYDLSSIVDKSFNQIDFLRDQITSTEEQLVALYYLTKHREDQSQVIERLGDVYYNKDFIFAKTEQQYGYPIVHKNVQNRMARLLKIAGLTVELTQHSLRHTHTSLLAEAGVSLEQIMDPLGHTDD